MALLITNYAFPAESLRAAAKIGIRAGSVIAAALGILVLVSNPPPGCQPRLRPRTGLPGAVGAAGG
jgi:Na+/H+ antiporter NhaA